MADSPLCPKCDEKKLRSNTYKVAGKQLYRCATCKRVFNQQMFEQEAFTWKDKPKEYAVWRASKVKKEEVEPVEIKGKKKVKRGA